MDYSSGFGGSSGMIAITINSGWGETSFTHSSLIQKTASILERCPIFVSVSDHDLTFPGNQIKTSMLLV